jgi:hypothetical protein
MQGTDGGAQLNEAYRRVEQLVIYVRGYVPLLIVLFQYTIIYFQSAYALVCVTACTATCVRESIATIASGQRWFDHPTLYIQYIQFLVLNALNERYHTCLMRSQELASQGLPAQDPTIALISAERLMYNHALELCQSAALDELFGNAHLASFNHILTLIQTVL